jgi:glutathione synthase
MTIRLGVIMDPIGSIRYKKDSTLAMLWEAQARGWEINYFEQQDLFSRDGIAYGDARLLKVSQNEKDWYTFQGEVCVPLRDLNVILMRKDPPFNEDYLYTTYLLDDAERHGSFVVNRPQALRDSNEKLFATYFPQCCPPTLVTQSIAKLQYFWQEHQDIVCKPLNSMGGASIFRLQKNDVNANAIFAALTRNNTLYIMAQKFIPDIKAGDKRILMINGEPLSHALARVPQANDWRGNLALGAKGIVQALTERDKWICAEVGPVLRKRGLYFVGIDVIGDYLTEINVTSPTCIRELDQALRSNISGQLLDAIENHIAKK